MARQWRTVFASSEQERRELMLTLDALSPSQLSFQPAPSAWSILQVVDHLVLVERALIADARRRLAKPVQVISLRENIMRFAVLFVLKSGIKVKTPAGAGNVIPQGNASLHSVNSRWAATRKDLEHLLEELPFERQTAAVFRHPMSGGLTCAGGLQFIRAHIRHHEAQIERLIKMEMTLAPSPSEGKISD